MPEPMHMFETEYLEFQPNIKKMSLIKGKTSKKLNFLPKKDRPLFEDFVLWPKPKVSETLWAGTPPSTCHESSYPATGKAPSGERNFSPSFGKRWTFKTRSLSCGEVTLDPKASGAQNALSEASVRFDHCIGTNSGSFFICVCFETRRVSKQIPQSGLFPRGFIVHWVWGL